MGSFYRPPYPQLPSRRAGSLARLAITLDVEPAVYAYTGSTVTFPIGRTIFIDPAVYLLSGSTVGLVPGSFVDVTEGTYAITGSVVALDVLHTISITPATDLLTGSVVSLEYDQVGGAFTLNSDPAEFAISGSDVGLVSGRQLAVTPDSLLISGSTVTFPQNRVLQVTPATYILDASLIELIRIITDPPSLGCVTVSVRALNSVRVDIN